MLPGVECMQNQPVCPLCTATETGLFCVVPQKRAGGPDHSWSIVRCRECGGGWTAPLPDQRQLASFYPPAYLGDTESRLEQFFSGRLQRTRSWRNELEKVKLVERFIGGGTILDVGCADGTFLWALNARNWTRHGVEHIKEVVRLVSARMPGLHLTAGDIFASSLHEGQFDVISLWHVFEHLVEPGRVLDRLFGLLKPGGWLFIAAPNIDSLQAHLFRQYWFAFDVPRHVFHFSPSSLRRLLARSGFQVRQCRYFSRNGDMHHWKHSLIAWSESKFGSRIPYYLLKPLLPFASAIERVAGHYGSMAIVSRRPGLRGRGGQEADMATQGR
jgi:2-polyprenyl-3-methyl-5-hydroxy-6-metoxy-1,4-benzoquinol methylase